jgi:sRNA-binding protein
MAVIETIGTALVAAGADQPFDIGFHQDLQHRLRHGS